MVAGLESGARTHLDILGLFWYFANADIIDDDTHADDIAYAVDRLRLKRLAILTGRFDNACEDRLADALNANGNTSLQYLEECR